MPQENSVTAWLADLKQGEAAAAQKLWNRFALRLTELARKKLGNAPKGIADEDDVALSVFRSICHGAASGRFNDVSNRDELWWLLMAVTKRKVIDHVRRENARKRGGGRVRSESGLGTDDDGNGILLDQLVADEPTPEYLLILSEQHQRLLELLRDDSLRQIAISRIEGYTVPEIAEGLAISTRSIERKLQLIRNAWARDLSIVE